jgi:hypothetical protein
MPRGVDVGRGKYLGKPSEEELLPYSLTKRATPYSLVRTLKRKPTLREKEISRSGSSGLVRDTPTPLVVAWPLH